MGIRSPYDNMVMSRSNDASFRSVPEHYDCDVIIDAKRTNERRITQCARHINRQFECDQCVIEWFMQAAQGVQCAYNAHTHAHPLLQLHEHGESTHTVVLRGQYVPNYTGVGFRLS